MISLTSPLRAQLLITNTTVVDVENKKLLPSRDVWIQNGIITAVGQRIKAPAGTQVIDGSGKYLIPGLVDSHVHFFQSGGIYTRPDQVDLRKFKPYAEEIAWTHQNMENILRRYARAGITTVVDPGSTINFLLQRNTFRLKYYAPTVYMTGPLLVPIEISAYEGLGNDGPFYVMKTEGDARHNCEGNCRTSRISLRSPTWFPAGTKTVWREVICPWLKLPLMSRTKRAYA